MTELLVETSLEPQAGDGQVKTGCSTGPLNGRLMECFRDIALTTYGVLLVTHYK